MAKVAVVIASVRPNRIGDQVAQWVAQKAQNVEGVEATLVDLRELDLPMFAEELPTAMAAPKEPKAQSWIQAISEADSVIFVTPEYNHAIPGSLKNATDYLTPASLANKGVGIVSYGFTGGVRAAEDLRAILVNFDAATVNAQVILSIPTDFENMSVFKPAAYHDGEVEKVTEQIVARSEALASLR